MEHKTTRVLVRASGKNRTTFNEVHITDTFNQFERHALECRPYPPDFPPRDLLRSLVQLYFDHVNVFTSLLHWPTFVNAVDDALFLRDDGFRQVVLLVCANGSRFSNDPRVLMNDSWHSAGWKYFSQIDMLRKSWLAATPPSLCDLQMHCVSLVGR